MISTLDQRLISSRKGAFTVVEMMISTTIIGFVSASMLAAAVFLSKSGISLSNHVNMTSDTRYALEYLSRDVVSSVNLTRAKTRKLIMTTENPDGSTQTVEYHTNRNAGVLRRRVNGGSWDTLVDNVVDARFYYHDSEDKSTNSIIDIKKVDVWVETSDMVLGLSQTHKIYSARFVMRNRVTP